MLYVSTRNTTDSYTAYRVLHEDYAPDGGVFAPYRLPIFSSEEHKSFCEKTFGERVAKILNIFFPVALSGWDVEFAIGRYPYKLTAMNHRLYIAELWHNLDGDFAFVEKSLYAKLCEHEHSRKRPSHWARIAIRISFLSAICCELSNLNISSIDFASITGDYLFVIAAWYVRKLGFTIDKIICTSDEEGGAWDIFQKGEINSSSKFCFEKDIMMPDVCLPSLELLIYENLGVKAVEQYLQRCAKGLTYQMDEEQLLCFHQNMEGTVVSRSRIKALIRSIFSTHNYLADPHTAIAYGGIQDYRSRAGESRTTMIIADTSPNMFKELIVDAVGVSPVELRKQINNR